MTWRGRNIYLVGLPGSGKSAIGRELQAILPTKDYAFVDLDETIEAKTGQSIASLFSATGEEEFRKLETAELIAIACRRFQRAPSIVATGGGAVLSPINRAIMRGSGITVHLDIPIREASQHVAQDIANGCLRPLFASDDWSAILQTMTSLANERGHYYDQSILHFVTRTVNGGKRTPAELAEEMVKALDKMSLNVALKPKFESLLGKSVLGDYPVLVGNGIAVPEIVNAIRDLSAASAMIITDANVQELHGAGIYEQLQNQLQGVRIEVFVVKPGEESKNQQVLFEVIQVFDAANLPRKSAVVLAVGGGVVSDLTGFAASIYKRGIPWIAVPTTLLGQVDAGIGGKTGIDLFGTKNLIGSFYPPNRVIADPLFLRTLPEREYVSGLAEVLKIALISSHAEWTALESNSDSLLKPSNPRVNSLIVQAACAKLKVVNEDEFERKSGKRELLNFGHTFAHALESYTCYEVYRHGEAVALGMRTAAWLSHRRGHLTEAEFTSIQKILSTLTAPASVKINVAAFLGLIKRDKKADRTVRLVLLNGIGSAFVAEVDEKELMPAIEYLVSIL